MSPRLPLALLLLLAPACDRTDKAGPTPPPTDGGVQTHAEPAMEAFTVGRGLGENEDDAYAEARIDLAHALFDDPVWVDMTGVEIHRREVDPQRVVREAEGRIAVTIGLPRERVAQVLSAFEHAEPSVQGPEAWQQTLQSYATEHLAVHTCLRRRALFESVCEPPDTAEVDRAVAELLAEVTLVPGLRGGVPVDADGKPRVDGTVYVLWRGLPLPGAPVAVGDPPQAMSTDAKGRVVLPTRDGRFSPTTVTLDPGALLGPVAADLPAPKVEVKSRPESSRRYALVVRGRPTGTEPLEAALSEKLADLGAPAHLDAAQRERLSAVTKGDAVPALAEIARRAAGAFDVVILVDYDSAFASRMGGNRVWYEASGSLTIYDAWSGKSTFHEPIRAKANGVSDASADTAARAKLAQQVAERIREAHRPAT